MSEIEPPAGPAPREAVGPHAVSPDPAVPDLAVPDPRSAVRLAQVERIAKILDSSIPVPGTSRTFGVDALLGLIPGVGGAAGMILSAGLIVQAVRMGARPATVLRMLLIAAADAGLGTVPVIGTITDFVLKANERNVDVLRDSALDPHRTASDSARIVALVVGLTAVIVAVVLIGIVAVLALLIAWLT